jgi:HSP20 family protein
MAAKRFTRKTTSKAKKAKAGKAAPAKRRASKAPAKRGGAGVPTGQPSLFRPLVALRRQLDDMLEDVTSHWPHLHLPRVEWPSLSTIEKTVGIVRFDVSENDNAVTVTAEVPGMEEKDIEVFVDDGMLTIRGEKKSEREKSGDNFYLSERQFGSFSRSIRLLHGVDAANISARFDKGVLTVTLPKSATTKSGSRRIAVKS